MQYKIAVLIGATLVISSCSYFFPQDNKHQPSQQKICSQLRQQLIYQNNPTGPNMINGTPIARARNMQNYVHYNCDQLEPGQ